MTPAASAEANVLDPALLRAVREQMAERPSEELLRIWVENDRFQWSAETFESVRSVLTERGMELPLQNAPPSAPAPDGPAELDPAARHWLRWLQPILIFGVVLSLLQAAGAVGRVWWFVAMFGFRPTASGWADWLTSPLNIGALADVTLVLLFLAAAWSALRLRPAARTLLLVYAWAAVGCAVIAGYVAVRGAFAAGPVDGYLFTYLVEIARWAAYPVVLLLLLRRPARLERSEPSGAAGGS